jgi:hypothetical protein
MRRCHYCNAARGITKDHIVPKSLGGPNIQWNYVRACQQCNCDKADSWPDCPCGVCTLAVEMYLWHKQNGGNHDAAKAASKLYQERLWAERIDRMEWWEDAGWIDSTLYGKKRRRRTGVDEEQGEEAS